MPRVGVFMPTRIHIPRERIEKKDDCEEKKDCIDGRAFHNDSNNMEKVEAAWQITMGTICSVLTDETKGD